MPHKVATIVSKTMPASIFLACLSGFVMQFTFSIIYGSGKVVKKKRTRKKKNGEGLETLTVKRETFVGENFGDLVEKF